MTDPRHMPIICRLMSGSSGFVTCHRNKRKRALLSLGDHHATYWPRVLNGGRPII
jgi:hypothetical protein